MFWWEDRVQHILDLGRKHHPEETAAFVRELRASQQNGDRPLDALVDALPQACRQMAQEVILEAGKDGAGTREIRIVALAAHRTLENEEEQRRTEYNALCSAYNYPPDTDRAG